MIKILSIGHSEKGGGIQTVFRVNNSISDSNVKVIKAFHSDDESIADIDLNRISDYKNPIKKILSYFFIPKNYFGLAKFLKKNKVDIIHIHASANLSLGILFAIKKYKKEAKVVFTSHGYGLACPVYSCYSYGKGSICTDCIKFGKESRVIKNKCDKRGYIFSTFRYIDFIIRKKVTNNYSLYDCIVTPSEYLQQLLIKSRHKFKNIKVVPNPIEMAPNIGDYDSKRNLITFVGRFSKEKNVDMLIDSFAQIIKDDNLSNLKLNILGDGPEKEYYFKKIKENGIESKVFISNKFLDRPELEKLLVESKVLVLPSVSPETFGLVLFEGVRYRLIPVSLNIGAQSENISKLGLGFLYSENTIESLNDAIKKAILNYDKLINRIDQANHIIDKDFSVQSYQDNIISTYYEALENN
ncbi:glycosyltransferase family 4 protein [Bacillus tuaregi]|uniref:glycosyltransferase family 4 protein n=1 Tax=Bacillus tuaregi TaxID=1816695 RepID=UPI0008F856FE|nr:glycosyltransferase [Bacillus tuaregi]